MSDPVSAIRAQIVNYLTRHPDAADTADGIATWWLNRPARDGDVLGALALLEESGEVKRTMVRGIAIWSRDRSL